MKITKIEAVYPSYKTSLAGWRPNLWQIIIKIHTDKNEVHGFGTGGGGKASIEIINGHLSNFLINKDINNLSDITNLFDKLFLRAFSIFTLISSFICLFTNILEFKSLEVFS